jgi:hypothetical protein
MRMTSERIRQKFPLLKTSWELLAYDAPATMDVTMANGKEMRMQLEHTSRYEIQKMVDTWK